MKINKRIRVCTYRLVFVQETNIGLLPGKEMEDLGLGGRREIFHYVPDKKSNPKLSGLKQQSSIFHGFSRLRNLAESNWEAHSYSMMSVVFPLLLPLFHLADILG